MKDGLVYDPYNYEILSAVQCVSGQVNAVSNQIQNGVDAVIRQVEVATRKPRKKRTTSQLACLQEGSIVILDAYDDGSQEVHPFIVNARGDWTVMRIVIEERTSDEFFGIVLENPSIGIIGRYEKLKAVYLYDRFVRTGIRFDPGVTKNKIADLLFTTFAPQIEAPKRTLTISERAGWINGKMISRETFQFAEVREFASFPVMKKSLISIDMTGEMWDAYFGEMKSICGWRDRFWIMIFPFVSVLSSLLNQEKIGNRICLNIIPVGKISAKRCCSWFQIFNRSNLSPLDADITEKALSKVISETRDEVLVLDCRSKAGESTYLTGKKKRNQELVTAIFSGDRDLQTGKAEAGLVMISDDYLRDSMVYNILLSDESLKTSTAPAELVESGISGVISEFIQFAENYLSEIQHILKRPEAINMEQAAAVEKVLEIIRMFGRYEGLDFLSEAGLREDFDVQHVLESVYEEPDDILEMFVQAVRREAPKFFFVQKEKADLSENVICYDECYLWISSVQLKNILKRHGLGKYVTQILHEAKKCQKLKTDSDGSATRRLQCGHVRQERYQFCRELFDTVGTVNIVELGGKVKC